MERTALYVDYENVLRAVQQLRAQLSDPATYTIDQIRRLIRNLISEPGTLSLRRAYADWEDAGMVGAQGALSAIGITPIYVQAKRGKSSADIELSLDAYEALLSKTVFDRFVIVGGDRDYLPLARRILEEGRKLVIIAVQDTLANDLMNLVGTENCWNFFDTTERVRASRTVRIAAGVEPAETPPAGSPLLDPVSSESQAECLKLLHRAVQEYGEEVYLGPFYRNFMNIRFQYWTDEQRKSVVSLLAEMGALKVESKPHTTGVGTYSVISINRTHEAVVAALGGGEHEVS